MSTIPSSLFRQFIQQGINKGLLKNVTKSLSEQQYLHHDYIDSTIAKSIESNGRTTIEQLAEILRLEQADVADAIERASPIQHQWTVIDDLIFTKAYVTKIEETIKKQIADRGYISVIAEAQENKLPYTLVKSLVGSLEGSNYIRYVQLEDLVFTDEFISSAKLEIADCLQVLDEPTAVSKLQKLQKAPEDLFYLLLEQMTKVEQPGLGILRGKGNRAIFEPSEYKDRQVLLIKSVFDSNECIDYKDIEELYPFVAPVDLISENYDKAACLFLGSCVVKAEVKDRAKAVIKSIDTFCDIHEFLPADFSLEATNQLTEIIMREIRENNDDKDKQAEMLVLDNGCIVTVKYVKSLVDKSRTYLRDLTRSVRQRTHKQQKEDSRLKNSDIVKALEYAGCSASIAEYLMSHTRKQMVNYYNELLKTPYFETKEIESEDNWVNLHKAIEMKKLINIRQCIYYNYQALPIFKDDSSIQKSLEKYILKTQCTDFLFHLVIYSVLSQSFNKKEIAESSSLCIQPEEIENEDITDPKQQKSLISHFIKADDHKYDKTLITKIEVILKKKDLHQFITDVIERNEDHLFSDDMMGSEEYKRVANEMVQDQLLSQLQQITSISVSTAPQLLHLVVLVIFQHIYKIPLYVSGKFVPAIMKVLTGQQSSVQCDTEVRQLLITAHAAIMDNNVVEHIQCFKELKQHAMMYKL